MYFISFLLSLSILERLHSPFNKLQDCKPHSIVSELLPNYFIPNFLQDNFILDLSFCKRQNESQIIENNRKGKKRLWWEKRKSSLSLSSPFPTMFSKVFFLGIVEGERLLTVNRIHTVVNDEHKLHEYDHVTRVNHSNCARILIIDVLLKIGWLLVLSVFSATLTVKVISWRSVTHMCFLAFSHQYQHNFLSKVTDCFSHMLQQR